MIPPSGSVPCTPEVAAIWGAYPDQAARGAGLRAIGRALDRGVPFQRLYERVRAFAISPLGQSRFRPHCSKWMDDERYDDPPEAWELRDKGGGKAADREAAADAMVAEVMREMAAERNGAA